MNRYFQFGLSFLLEVLGLNFIFRQKNKNQVVILWYHGVCQNNFNLLKGYDERHIPIESFEKQLVYLKKKDYKFVTMRELLIHLKSEEPLPQKLACLTFDDGFLNVVTNAYPLMKKYGAKGTFYVVTSLMGKQQLLWTDFVETVVRNAPSGILKVKYLEEVKEYELSDKISRQKAMKHIKRSFRKVTDAERLELLKQFHDLELKDVPSEFSLCDWADLQELDDSILEVGSHTQNHPNLSKVSDDKMLEMELVESKQEIDENLKDVVVSFCYPAGNFDDRVVDYVQKAGYTNATSTISGFVNKDSDVFRLKRIGVIDNFPFFKASVSGSYLWFHSSLKKVLKK